MVLPKDNDQSTTLTAAQKRRLRRKKLHAVKNSELPTIAVEISNLIKLPDLIFNNTSSKKIDSPVSAKPDLVHKKDHKVEVVITDYKKDNISKKDREQTVMSSKDTSKSREDVLAAREAKKLAKQKVKNKDGSEKPDTVGQSNPEKSKTAKCVDEVDRAHVKETVIVPTKDVNKENVTAEAGGTDSIKTKEQILAERAAKKAAKQVKKKGGGDVTANPELTVKDVVETLKDIKHVAKDVQDLTAKVSAITFEAKKPAEPSSSKPNESKVEKPSNSDEGKSKAVLKAERRAKQEAQRAAKQAAVQKAAKDKVEATPTARTATPKPDVVKEKSPKLKSSSKPKPASNNVDWFQHCAVYDKGSLNKIALNSNLHPAIVKLGVQTATRVVDGSNARCIALLHALKQMLRDYSLPARTEFARGVEAQLATSLQFVSRVRPLAASQTNAVQYLRHHLTQLPHNVDEFDAKKILQQEIDHYIEDQIDKAGEAISMTIQKKISPGDNILTYGYCRVICRCVREAWAAGVRFRAVVGGARGGGGGRDMLRLLAGGRGRGEGGPPCSYVDITALSSVMHTINKVILGADALLVNGSVLARAGSALVALVARAHNVPVLVVCETHRVSGRVQTDAFVHNELDDPDALLSLPDGPSPLQDWRSNPNLSIVNLAYDVIPADLVSAVVTEKAILPCTSAPVVLRTKLTEYGM